MSTWIVVSDGSRARFFMARGAEGEWVKFEELEHPPSRVKRLELVTDAAGKGPDKRAFDMSSDPKQVEEARFAHQIAQTLDTAHAQDAFQRLMIVAPPRFMGMLRAALSPRVQKAIYATLDKDYTRLDQRELQERVPLPQER